MPRSPGLYAPGIKVAFDQIVRSFGRQLPGADGLFYYAGHGLQVNGANYLVPVDANPTRETDLDFELEDVELVLRQMEGSGTRLNLVFLDACRNNPFGGRGLRAIDSGLAQMRAPEDTLISFATQPGSVAQDGYDGHSKTPIAAADLLNDRVVPFFEEHDVKLLRVLTDRGSEYCGNPERHEFELYLAVEDIDHSRTKAKSPQTNGICERFHKTVLNEFYRVAFRKKVYRSIDELQADLDCWIKEYNEARPLQGRWCFGKTPMQTFLDAMPMAKEKMVAA